jgi:hypothetical protein
MQIEILAKEKDKLKDKGINFIDKYGQEYIIIGPVLLRVQHDDQIS